MSMSNKFRKILFWFGGLLSILCVLSYSKNKSEYNALFLFPAIVLMIPDYYVECVRDNMKNERVISYWLIRFAFLIVLALFSFIAFIFVLIRLFR